MKVTALDTSEALLSTLIEKAKEEDLNIQVVQADIRTFKLDRKFPLIILPFQSMEELTRRNDQLEVLERVSEHLQKMGISGCLYIIQSIMAAGTNKRPY